LPVTPPLSPSLGHHKSSTPWLVLDTLFLPSRNDQKRYMRAARWATVVCLIINLDPSLRRLSPPAGMPPSSPIRPPVFQNTYNCKTQTPTTQYSSIAHDHPNIVILGARSTHTNTAPHTLTRSHETPAQSFSQGAHFGLVLPPPAGPPALSSSLQQLRTLLERPSLASFCLLTAEGWLLSLSLSLSLSPSLGASQSKSPLSVLFLHGTGWTLPAAAPRV
jgi:hypothetical protein